MSLDLACPSRAKLEAFVSGTAEVSDVLEVRSHLEQCNACRSAFQLLAYATVAIPAAQIELPAESSYSFLAAPQQPDEIGRLGNYRVLRLLGQGGMGLVFLAEDVQLQRSVALKVLRPDLKADPEMADRFLREARALAGFKHDHLVTLYQAGQEGDVVYFAMELLEGETLESWMKRSPSPDMAEVVRLGKEIAAGLAFIHRKNHLHRDVKPANIWLEAPDRRVKILDLGLARQITGNTSLTMSGMILGTPDYMSPEQARGEELDARTDLFSLGGVLYQLCTQRKPFQGASFSAVLMSLASETPPSPRTLNEEVSESLSNLIMMMLDRNPKNRPASAETVLRWLEKVEAELRQPGDRTLLTKAGSKSKTLRKKKKPVPVPEQGRSRALAVAGVVIALSLVLGIAAGLGIWALQAFPIRARLGPPPAQNEVFLRDLPETAREHWPMEKNPGPDPRKEEKKGPKEFKEPKEIDFNVRFHGAPSPHGIFMHPPVPPFENDPASITFRLNKEYQSFKSEVSLNDGPPQSEAPITFWVYGDGKLLWKSAPVSSQQDTQTCNVAVKGVSQLKIAVTCAGEPRGAHAVWIEPTLAK